MVVCCPELSSFNELAWFFNSTKMSSPIYFDKALEKLLRERNDRILLRTRQNSQVTVKPSSIHLSPSQIERQRREYENFISPVSRRATLYSLGGDQLQIEIEPDETLAYIEKKLYQTVSNYWNLPHDRINIVCGDCGQGLRECLCVESIFYTVFIKRR